jgi:hypothetical protein
MLIIAQLLTGCCVPTHVYIRNNSNLPKNLLLKKWNCDFNYPALSVTLIEIKNIKINLNLADKLTTKLSFSNENDTTYQLSILPQSLVLIEKSMNFGIHNFTSICVEDKEIMRDEYHCNWSDTNWKHIGRIMCYEIP